MSIHVLGNAMVVQRQNDQNVISHTYAKAQHKWDELIIVVEQCLPLLKPILIKLALRQLLQVLGFIAWDVKNVF
jgi:hypothetical protein